MRKEDLFGKKVRIKSLADFYLVAHVCCENGLTQASWSDCDYSKELGRDYGVLIGKDGIFLVTAKEHWVSNDETMDRFVDLEEIDISEFRADKPPKPTRTVYEKAELNLAEKIDLLKSGEWLYRDRDGRGHIDWHLAKEWKLERLESEDFYRKTERPVVWQDEVKDFVERCEFEIFEQFASDVRLSGRREKEFLEMCRVALRANGEL